MKPKDDPKSGGPKLRSQSGRKPAESPKKTAKRTSTGMRQAAKADAFGESKPKNTPKPAPRTARTLSTSTEAGKKSLTRTARPARPQPAAGASTRRKTAPSLPAARTSATRPAKALEKGVSAKAPERSASTRKELPAKKARDTRPSRPRAATKEPVVREPKAAQAVPEPLEAMASSEEEQIEAAKYTPRAQPARRFEEERFIFPQSYGITRLRLLVKDPFWLFAHWDVDARVLAKLREEMGERTVALSRLTLKVLDVQHGGGPVIFLPEGARSWYVRADDVPRAYRAELGVTLPSGDFRLLASSNLVTTPRVGASSERVARRQRWETVRQAASPSASAASGAGRPRGSASQAGPWQPEPQTVPQGASSGWVREGSSPNAGSLPEGAGASDIYRR